MNAADSAAYAIGMDLAKMVQGFDSTINIEVVGRALNDQFLGKAIFTEEQAERAIQNFVTTKQLAEQSKQKVELDALSAQAVRYMDSIATLEGISKTKSGLCYRIEKMGGERLPQEGDMVTVHYTLKLPDGTIIDSSYDRGEPITYPNVKGQMIDGFTEGIQLLGEGGKATLYLPPSLGYQDSGQGGIKPYQPLIFEVTLLGITPKK